MAVGWWLSSRLVSLPRIRFTYPWLNRAVLTLHKAVGVTHDFGVTQNWKRISGDAQSYPTLQLQLVSRTGGCSRPCFYAFVGQSLDGKM